METNLEQLKCGECGEAHHRIYRRPNQELITECINCESQTEIIIYMPEIQTRNVKGYGSLCNLD